MADPLPICTIGHSTATVAEFVELLRVGEVTMVVDVRTVPRSRHNPQYNLDVLPEELAAFQVGHEYIRELGGLRGKSHAIAPEVNGLWRNQSFHNYADYALSREFADGLARLVELASGQRCAIMCAEAVWWRCHRRIIADYLLTRDYAVTHLMWPHRAEPAGLTPGALVNRETVTYPAASSAG
ncbi:MAG TPA: DUF488 domain-containing protein [Croceibacterium sp.]|jgi:uncharacterized protein (DUF488 family)